MLHHLLTYGKSFEKILVTGITSGLGLELTKLLLLEGLEVVGIGKDQMRLDAVSNDLASSSLTTIKCDLKEPEEIRKSLSNMNDIDVLVNNAGIIAYQPLENHEDLSIVELIKTNVIGTILVTKVLTKQFKQRNTGSIINVASTSGLPTGGHANESVYMASKYAVQGFTEGLKKEFVNEKSKVRVLGFYPGGMDTPLFSKSGDKKDTSKFMDPKEVAKVLAFMINAPDGIKIDHVVVNRNKFL